MSNVLQDFNSEMATAVETVQRSLVRIGNGRGGMGAGTIWHPDGLIITNAHVVGRHALTVILTDRRRLPARVLASDKARDLAALMVDAAALPTIELGDSRKLQPGQWVFAVGHPWGVVGAATAGVVIGVEAQPHELPTAGREWIVVNLRLRPGYSGGPLVDGHGRLVGINTMMTGPDVGMAVPVHLAKAFLRETLGSRSAAA